MIQLLVVHSLTLFCVQRYSQSIIIIIIIIIIVVPVVAMHYC